MSSDLVFQHERVDDLQIDNLKIIQNPDWFCFGTDAVLLSDFASKTIKKDAFSNCDKLSDIQGMENITEYDSDVVGSDSYIYGVPYLKNKEVIIIGNALVKYNILSEKIIKVPEGITKICSYAI